MKYCCILHGPVCVMCSFFTCKVLFSVLKELISSCKYPGSGNSLGGGGGGGWNVAGRSPLGGGVGGVASKLKSSIFLQTCETETGNLMSEVIYCKSIYFCEPFIFAIFARKKNLRKNKSL